MMKQKADHHLTFLAERNERPSNSFLDSLSSRRTGRQASVAAGSTQPPNGTGGDEDAAGESDDAAGEGEQGQTGQTGQDFPDGAKRAQGGSAASQPPEC